MYMHSQSHYKSNINLDLRSVKSEMGDMVAGVGGRGREDYGDRKG